MGGGGIEVEKRAYVVEVNVSAAIVLQHEIADRVSALDRVPVAGEGFQKPGVFFGDESMRFRIRPKLDSLASVRCCFLPPPPPPFDSLLQGRQLGKRNSPCICSRDAVSDTSPTAPSIARGCYH